MNLKKNKKLKKKLLDFQPAHDLDFQPAYNTFAGVHVYRSDDYNAPFSQWKRMTEKPTMKTNFTDRYEGADKEITYFYKFTDVDIFGNESEPYDPEREWSYKDGKKREITRENKIIGLRLYWSIDPDLPLEDWTPFNDKPIPEKNMTFKCPVKEPFYMYAKYVNVFGQEIGQPSDIQRIVPKP